VRERDSKFKVTVDSLQSFLAVVEYGSFSKAAEHVGLSQPAVSQQVIELERKVGAPLLIRQPQPRSVLLTGAGERFLKHALRIQEELVAAGLIAEDAQILARPKKLRYDSKDPDNLIVNIDHRDDVADGFRKAVEYDRAMSQMKDGPRKR
jgi:molybdenum-dependent DNA-binding transcriptional regulator ModE